jgi:hypothetical protein
MKTRMCSLRGEWPLVVEQGEKLLEELKKQSDLLPEDE